MSKHRAPYAPEFRQQIIDLVRAGRSPEELAQEFERFCRGKDREAIEIDM